jgi:hypothetical protein
MTTRKVLFLDIDGVLHRGIARRAGNQVVSSAPAIIGLFEYAPVLDELLCPYPDVEIVLSSDWALVLGVEYTVAAMPLSALRDRVVGATYEGCTFNEMLWPLLTRGEQVLDYVARHSITKWLAIDDRVDGFASCRDRLVNCQTEVGLGDRAVIELFRRRLRQFFSETTIDEPRE